MKKLFMILFVICVAVSISAQWSWKSQLSTGTILNSIYFSDLTACKTARNVDTKWEIQKSGTSEMLISLQFTDANNGTAVGSNGTIIRTTDGGINWKFQKSGTNYELGSVHFTDQNNGWVAGENGTILKTTNGGKNWNSQKSGTTTHWLNSIYFTDQNTGWAIGSELNVEGTATSSLVLRTTNGGKKWITQNKWEFEYSREREYFSLESVYFIDPNNGWAVGNGSNYDTGADFCVILKTINGGKTWEFQKIKKVYLTEVFFIDINTGWAVGNNGAILNTTNGGKNWDTQPSGATTIFLFSVHFADQNNGCVVGDGGTILITTNGGKNWDSQKSFTNNSLHSVYFTDPNTGWAVGYDGTILKMNNK